LDRWHKRGGAPQDIPHDVLLAYCRLQFRHHLRLGTTGRMAPEPLAAVVAELAGKLPSDEHRHMLRQRVSWVTGKRW
jgi:hypothetical protein